jgi:hypothetical protein
MKPSTAHEQSEAHSRDEKNTALSSPSSLLPELLSLLLAFRFLSFVHHPSNPAGIHPCLFLRRDMFFVFILILILCSAFAV